MPMRMRRWLVRILSALILLVLAIPACWGAAALWYQLPGGPALRAAGVGAWVALCVTLLVLAWQAGRLPR